MNEERAAVRETMEENTERQNEIDTVRAERETTETLTRLMPDGSIRLTEIEGGKIVSETKFRPHMEVVLDMSAPLPQNADGTADITQNTIIITTSTIFFMIIPPSIIK